MKSSIDPSKDSPVDFQTRSPVEKHAYRINPDLEQFINNEVLPLTDLDTSQFWADFIQLLKDLAAENKALLARRDALQAQIDEWHLARRDQPVDKAEYKQFLMDIGYLVEPPAPFKIESANIDTEIAQVAGPQLVVPVKNARFALNAANARWGSLYDALYGTDAIDDSGELLRGHGYNPLRGQKVIDTAKDFLDQTFPLQEGSHHDICGYSVYFNHLMVRFADGSSCGLVDGLQFVAYQGDMVQPEAIVLQNNGLRVELVLNARGNIGQSDQANLDDVLVESALTTIMDCEDSVAAVDCEDKLEVYRNWLGLMQGTLQESFEKNGQRVVRKLERDSHYKSRDSRDYLLPRRSLQLVRNVGLHMYSDMIVDAEGNECPEGIIDAVVTSMIAAQDLQQGRAFTNSRTGSIYIVKPKMHGPDEVAFTCRLFGRVEDMLGLPRNTLKIGIMDEERRTSLNLAACIERAKQRVAFINTGFLDRTGDEIHTSMEAGVFLPKGAIKGEPWFSAYENSNVTTGLACGFRGKAQIGKGMWPVPDAMKKMLEEKISHPRAGANTAWVPSPTAATLHALHYHQVDVQSMQESLMNEPQQSADPMLMIPLNDDKTLSQSDIQQELENNAQGILGYVVHWINSGTGCSKIPDINHVGLMEDRATLRISSQHIANWLHHGVCSMSDVDAVLKKMAKVVDQQNQANPDYLPLAKDPDSNLAFQAARALIVQGVQEPNGYTEPTLHAYRRQFKAAEADRARAKAG